MQLKTVDDVAFEKLRTSKRSEGHTYIKGTPNYEIIQNMQYCDQFQFQAIDLCDDLEDLESNNNIIKKLYISDHNRLDGNSKENMKDCEFVEETNSIKSK